MSLTVTDLIYAYSNGIFPMAEEDGTIHWYAPDPRAIIPFGTYKPSKSLRSTINQNRFELRVDHNFKEVMRRCATPRFEGDATWISEELIQVYTELHHLGMAHSVETYQQGELVGGLYGVALGGAFFGESMFHQVSNASKVAFHYLVTILRKNGYQLLDTQFINDNVARYGATEISRNLYEELLFNALQIKCSFSL